MSDWIFAIEFGGGFLILLLLGWWQFRAMDREEREEKERLEREEHERSERELY